MTVMKKGSLLAIAIASTFSISANAIVEDKGLIEISGDLVYSKVSDVTWTKNAGLLTSLVDAYDFTASNELSSANFSKNDTTGIWTANVAGSKEFIGYLNSSSYAGKTNWRLPTIVTGLADHACVGGTKDGITNSGSACGFNPLPAEDTTAAGDEFAELFYVELGATPKKDANGVKQDPFGWNSTGSVANNTFVGALEENYWTGTEDLKDSGYTFYFAGGQGRQLMLDGPESYKNVWAVSDMAVAAVPEPETYAMFLAGLGLLAVARRRKSA